MFTVMTTRKSERFRLLRRMHEHGNSLEAMISSLEKSPPVRVPGTAVYMSRALNVIPFALLHNLKHNKVLHERVILLTLRTEDAPYVHNVRRVQIEQLSPSFWRVVASYGWRETPNVEEVFHRCGPEGLSCRMMETSFFMSHESLIIGKRPWYLRLRGKLYLLLQRNALRAPDQLRSRQTGLSSSVPGRNLMSKSPSIAKGFCFSLRLLCPVAASRNVSMAITFLSSGDGFLLTH